MTDAEYRTAVRNVSQLARESGAVITEAEAREVVDRLREIGVTPQCLVRSVDGRLWLRGLFDELH